MGTPKPSLQPARHEAPVRLSVCLSRAQQTGTHQPSEDELVDFFNLVDRLLWNSVDEEGRQFSHGWLNMNRPAFLMSHGIRRSGAVGVYAEEEPSSFYRSFTDACYGILCSLGINGFVNDVARALSF